MQWRFRSSKGFIERSASVKRVAKERGVVGRFVNSKAGAGLASALKPSRLDAAKRAEHHTTRLANAGDLARRVKRQ